MLKSEAISRIQRKLGYRTDQGGPVLEELVDAQNRLERGVLLATGGTFMPWFMTTEIATITGTVNEERLPLPADFTEEVDEGGLWLYDATAEEDERWTSLRKDALNIIRVAHPGVGDPVVYAQLGDYFRALPVSETARTYKLIYRQKDTVLTAADDIENRWLKYAPSLLMGEAGSDMAAGLRDKVVEDYFIKMRSMESFRLFVDTERRSHNSRRYVMGGED